MRWIQYPAAVVLVAGSGLAWATSATASDSDNAATWYVRAFGMMTDIDEAAWERVTDASETEIDDHLREVIDRGQPVLSFALHGTQQPWCVFAPEASLVRPASRLPAKRLRRIADLMRAAALVRLDAGDTDRAAELVAAMFRLSGHVTADRMEGAAPAAARVFRMADDLAELGVEDDLWSPAHFRAFDDAVATLDPDDPIALIECSLTPQGWLVEWLDQRFAARDDPAAISESLRETPGQLNTGLLLAGLDEDRFSRECVAYDALLDRMADAFAVRDPELAPDLVAGVIRDLDASGAPFPFRVVPLPYTRVYNRVVETRSLVADRRAAWAVRAAPPRETTTVDRVVETLLSRPHGAALRRHVVQDAPRLTDESVAWLADASELIDVARRAILPDATDAATPVLASASLDHGYVVLRLLEFDTRHALARDEFDAADVSLAAMLRTADQLSRSDQLLGAVVCHEAVLRFNALLRERQAAAGGRPLDPAIVAALRGVHRLDPMRFRTTLAQQRAALSSWLAARSDQDEQRIREVVYRWEAARILAALAVLATTEDADGARRLPVDVSWTRSLFSPEDLSWLSREAEALHASLSRGDVEALGRATVPDLAGVTGRVASARADRRRCEALLVEAAVRPPGRVMSSRALRVSE